MRKVEELTDYELTKFYKINKNNMMLLEAEITRRNKRRGLK